MKVYNLNIDTSKPVNQVMQMQQNSTGLLKLNVTNDGKSIRDLSCMVYDGETEVPSTDNGFKIDMGKNDKVVKIEAKSEPIMCQMGYFVSTGSGSGMKTYALPVCQLSQGVYSQDEFKAVAAEVAKKLASGSVVCFPTTSTVANINISEFRVSSTGEYVFWRNELIPENEPIVVTGDVEIVRNTQAKRNAVTGTYDYPAFGEYTDYQLDTTIRPSANAPYDGEYEEPLTEIEVDGVKFVPTTLTIDGVEYKVLAEEQPTPDPEPEPEPDPEPDPEPTPGE
jgi:hypothetical protein